MREFIVGGLYFVIWYHDREILSPVKRALVNHRLFLEPDSVIFIGRKIESDTAERPTWYFQDTESYCERGADPTVTDNEDPVTEARIYCLHEGDLFQVVDCKDLAKEVLECLDRRLSHGLHA
jgi:hypothetical protein